MIFYVGLRYCEHPQYEKIGQEQCVRSGSSKLKQEIMMVRESARLPIQSRTSS
jgi:hypothetical protein